MKIGLTYTGSEHKHRNYINWLKGNEDIQVIELSISDNNAAEMKKCNALVLSGGIDSHPVLYNGRPDYPNQPGEGWQLERDLFEKSLYEYALDNSLPVLAICRGLQLVNVLHGGTLVQDLGDLNETHKAEEETDQRHSIDIIENTLLSNIVKIKSGEVNSAHHQAVDRLSEDLIVNCTSEDGTIEGAEWKDKENKPFLLCVQWHPERMYKAHLQDSPLSKNIRNHFIAEIKKSGRGQK